MIGLTKISEDIGNAIRAKSSSDSLDDAIAYQEYLNKLSMENAKQVHDLQSASDQIAMQFTHDENELAWQRQMNASNTAYQRAVADMRKAGINPVLAYANGGASTPSSAGGSGVSSARHAAQLNLDNIVYQYKALVKELSQSAKNAKTAANAQIASSAIIGGSNLIRSLVSLF